MVTCSLNALKKSSKRKEMRIRKKEKVEVLQNISLTLYLLAKITLTLFSSPAIICYFGKVNFQGFNLL